MSCIITDFKLSFDVDNYIKTQIVDAIKSTKDRLLVASFIEDNPKAFFDWIYNNIPSLKRNMDEKGVSSDDFSKVNTLNKSYFRSGIKKYYNSIVKNVKNYTSNSSGQLVDGFTDIEAKQVAIQHTGNLLIEEFVNNLKLPKTKQVSNSKLINKVIERVYNNIKLRTNILLSEQINAGNKKAIAHKEHLDELEQRINKAKQDYLTEKKNKIPKVILDTYYSEYSKEVQRYKFYVEHIFKDLSTPKNTVAWEQNKNYLALYNNLRTSHVDFLNEVLATSKMLKYAKTFKDSVEASKIYEENLENDSGFVNNDSENIDETTKNWESSVAASFLNEYSTKIKIYFDTLYTLNSPITDKTPNKSFDTDNALGVPMTKHSTYWLAQLANIVNESISYDDFVNKITKAANNKKELYTLTALVQDMKKDRIFGNYVYSQLSKDKVAKSMVIINSDSFDFRQSNKASENSNSIFYNMFNNIRGTYRQAFDIYDVVVLQNYKSIINKTSYDSTIQNATSFLAKYVQKYFPNINSDVVYDYINSKEDKKQAINHLLDVFINLNKNIENFINKQNQYNLEYAEAYGKFAKAIEMQDYNVKEPIKQFAETEYNKISIPLSIIANIFSEVLPIYTELNSANGENNLSSDIINNSYLMNFKKLLNSTDEDGNFTGLMYLYDKLGKAEQNKFNPILFGTKDKQGLFIKDSFGNITPNPNFKQIFDISLFNGIKDTNAGNGTVYDKMGKSDLFITQLIAFSKSFNSETNAKDNAEVGSYFMKTPSDAPKNFIITSHKYKVPSLSFEQTDVDNYINKIILSKIPKTVNEKLDKYNINILNKSNLYRRNTINTDMVFMILKNNGITSLDITRFQIIKNGNETIVPLVYNDGKNNKFAIYIKGSVNEKNVLSNGTIEYISPLEISDNNFALEVRNLTDILIDFANKDVINIITEDLMKDNLVNPIISTNSEIFNAYHQILKQEVYNFVTQLNSILEKDANGDFIVKSNINGLFDFFHRDGENIIKTNENGTNELAGKVFNFNKFDNIVDSNIVEEIKSALYLYGNADSLFIPVNERTNQGLKLNLNSPYLSNIIRINKRFTPGYNKAIEFIDTSALNDILTNITKEWLNRYERKIYENYQIYKNIIPSEIFANTSLSPLDYVRSAVLNNTLFQMSIDDIFEGNAGFYKNAQTFLKRAKEIQAGGYGYATTNLIEEVNFSNIDILENGKPIIINERLGLTARRGIKAMTIANTVQSFEDIEILKNALQKADKATEEIKEIIKPFVDKTKTNDAISYITLDEFIRRRWADGTLSEYQDLINQLLDPDIPIEKLDLSGINSRIQLQKNYYYDLKLDKSTGVLYPRQIKNAEFVLIPKLLPKDSSLRTLYDLMVKHDIGQVNTAETDKAAKRFIGQYWDNKGIAHPEIFEQQISNVNNLELYDYSYFYKQQEVPEHMRDEHNKAGVQIFKKIQDNVPEHLKPIVEKLQANFSQNIKDSFEDLIYNLGFDTDEFGRLKNRNVDISGLSEKEAYDALYNLNYTKFLEKARIEAQRLGLDSNFIEYLTPNQFGVSNMPNWANSAGVKLESVAQSIFNSAVTRQTIPGWHGAQMTGVGYSKKLQYHPNGEPYIEVYLPRWSSLLPQRPDDSNLTQEEFDAQLLKQIEKEGLDLHIGYRIPTEGKQSVAVMKVIGFLDETYGSTIIVPDAWVTQTGSDFDIDSIYGMCFEFYQDKNGKFHQIKYNENAPIEKRYLDKVKEKLNNRKKHPKYKEAVEEFNTEVKVNKLEATKKLAKALDIISFEDFVKLSVEGQMTRSQRNNQIVRAFIDIMQDPSSLEENLTVSGFDNLIEAKKKYDKFVYANSDNVSVYDTFTQLQFFENAINGRMLKAFSVNRDTFNSVNNKVKTEISEAIEVNYGKDYDFERIKKSYPEAYKNANGDIIVPHTRLGWSNDNKNIAGKILTAYSSQTTSHILDAMKEGTLFNENEYTFGTFKTLIDLGIDYDTAVAFLYQPAITLINKNYFTNKSVYSKNNSNPIDNAIRDIAIRRNILIDNKVVNQYTSIEKIINRLQADKDFINAFNKHFNVSFLNPKKSNNENIILSRETLLNRLNLSQSLPNNQNEIDAIDLGVVLLFDRYKKLTNIIEKAAKLARPDSYGAKQTIYETRKIIDKLNDSFNEPNSALNKTLRVKSDNIDISFLEAIYPNYNSADGINISESKYPYLASFLKYATIQSVNINKDLFLFESDSVHKVVDLAQAVLGFNFTLEQYQEFKKYIVSNIFNNLPFFVYPQTINKHGFVVENVKLSEEYENDIREKEYQRVLGLIELVENFPYIEDINNLTEEQIDNFAKLTPLQKVNYMQEYFNSDNDNIFKYFYTNRVITSELNKNGYSRNRITFKENTNNIEDLLKLWDEAFFSNNPLIRLTAVDLVKYAFLAEGFNFKKGAITKLITNRSLYMPKTNKGLNIIQDAVISAQTLTDWSSFIQTDFLTNFARSHSDYIPSVFINENKDNLLYKKLLNHKDKYRMISIPEDNTNDNLMAMLGNKNFIKIIYTNKNYKKSTVLYKIQFSSSNSNIHLIPLNLLDRNETNAYSMNNNNNKYLKEDFYYAALNTDNFIAEEEAKKYKIDRYKYQRKIDKTNLNYLLNNVNGTLNINAVEQAKLNKVLNDINDTLNAYGPSTGGSVLVLSESFIFNNLVNEAKSGIIQYIERNGNTVPVLINKYSNARIKRYLNGKEIDLTPNENSIVSDIERMKLTNPKIYKIETIPDTILEKEISDSKEIEVKEHLDNLSVLNSLNTDIVLNFGHKTYSKTSKIGYDILKDIYNDSLKNLHTEFTETAIYALNRKNINVNSLGSIENNKSSVYRIAANYYEKKYKKLIESINNFILDNNGNILDIANEKLYDILMDNKSEYQRLLNLILDAKTFGTEINEIFNLNLEYEDNITKESIEKIQNLITNLNNNVKLNKAIDLIYNHYLAKVYSTNPNIKSGFSDIRTRFGDTGWWDLHLSDIADINNKQIQIVVKAVNAELQQARFDALENQQAFVEKLNKLTKGKNINYDKIIDKDGKFIQKYTDDFIKQRNNLNYKVKLSRLQYLNAVKTNNIDKILSASLAYQKDKLARDKWFYKNVQQELIGDYYKEITDITENTLNNAPEEFALMQYLQQQLAAFSNDIDVLDDKDLKYKDSIKQQYEQLFNHKNADGTVKNDKQIEKINILKKYRTKLETIKETYLEYKDIDEFQKALNNRLKIIKKLEKDNATYSFEDLMNIEEYKNAYDWIKNNARWTTTAELKSKIDDAYKTLYGDNLEIDSNKNNKIKEIIDEVSITDRLDIYGNIIGSKYTEAQIKQIKEIAEQQYAAFVSSYSNNNPIDNSLIKEIPSDIPIFTQEFYKEIFGDEIKLDESDKAKEKEIITKVNNLLKKIYNKDTNQFDTNLWINLTVAEKEELAKNISDLKDLRSYIYQNVGNKKDKSNKIYRRYKNNKAFDREYLIYQSLKTVQEKRLWLSTFAELDQNGIPKANEYGKHLASNLLFSYIAPIKDNKGNYKDTKYIDIKKTEAKKFIINNFEVIPTKYYHQEKAKAISNDTYNEWFENNHVYNPYTRQYEPIKIWTTREIKPTSDLIDKYNFIPTSEEHRRIPKQTSLNSNYNKTNNNYNSATGEYNNRNYAALSTDEIAVSDFLQSTINNSVHNRKLKRFFDQGYIPRKGKVITDAAWVAKQAIGIVGLNFNKNGIREWYDDIDYKHNEDIQFDMAELIKNKGYKDVPKRPIQDVYETDVNYAKRLNDWKLEKEEIEKQNLALEKAVRDNNYPKIFEEFVGRITEYNARENIKNLIYLTSGDLKENKVFDIDGWDKLKKTSSPNEQQNYRTKNQNNSYEIFNNWARRVIYEQYKKPNNKVKYADLIQNITSAKYMILNLTGGISNVTIGYTNILEELFAEDYFDKNSFAFAHKAYAASLPAILASMYSDKTDNFGAALLKYFAAVDVDAVTERKPGESLNEYTERMRDMLYGLQSGGEHMMQNIVLLAMLNSHRIYTNSDGKITIGSYQDYTKQLEQNILLSIIKTDENYLLHYRDFLDTIKTDKDLQYKYESYQRNFVKDFLNTIESKTERNKITKEFVEKRQTILKEAKKEFNKYPKLYDQFELKNGYIKIKNNSLINNNLVGQFRSKVLNVNKQIHGVYDKIGAAKIESMWFGSLVMQYHKHIYPGLLKRFRRKGFYNEQVENIKKGSYISTFDFLTQEYKNAIDKNKQNRLESGALDILQSFKNLVIATYDSFINVKFNWDLLPEWEKANIKRTIGDLCGMAAAFLTTFVIYMLTDDDDRKGDDIIGTTLYLADRLFSESQMYTPWGLYAEVSTLYSSPLAAQNSIEDLFKAINYTWQYLTDEDFDLYYKTGINAKQNKFTVLLRRNIPGLRVYDRLNNMAKNNSYYRINESSLNIKAAANLAEYVKENN